MLAQKLFWLEPVDIGLFEEHCLLSVPMRMTEQLEQLALNRRTEHSMGNDWKGWLRIYYFIGNGRTEVYARR